MTVCGTPIELTDGDAVLITCGSIHAVVYVGPVELFLEENLVVVVPSKASTRAPATVVPMRNM